MCVQVCVCASTYDVRACLRGVRVAHVTCRTPGIDMLAHACVLAQCECVCIRMHLHIFLQVCSCVEVCQTVHGAGTHTASSQPTTHGLAESIIVMLIGVPIPVWRSEANARLVCTGTLLVGIISTFRLHGLEAPGIVPRMELGFTAG